MFSQHILLWSYWWLKMPIIHTSCYLAAAPSPPPSFPPLFQSSWISFLLSIPPARFPPRTELLAVQGLREPPTFFLTLEFLQVITCRAFLLTHYVLVIPAHSSLRNQRKEIGQKIVEIEVDKEEYYSWLGKT